MISGNEVLEIKKSGFDQYGEYVFIVIGIYCLIRGFITLTTGKINPMEEQRLGDISENGLKKYKMLSAVSNIIGGLLTIAIAVIKIFDLIESNVFKIVGISIIVVLLIVYVLLRNHCKKVK